MGSSYRVELEALLEKAQWYERETQRIRTLSGYAAASRRERETAKSLERLIDQIMARRPKTMRGVLIQCQALKAWRGVSPWHQAVMIHKGRPDWAQSLAASVTRIAA